MKSDQAEERARCILHYFNNAGERNFAKTCKHFEEEGMHRYTVTRILKRCIERQSTELRKRGGHSSTEADKQFLEDADEIFRTNPGISVREAARKLHVPTSTMSYTKVHRLGIRAFTQKPAPKYVKDQEQRARAGCGEVLRRSHGHVLIMDDETYVYADPSQVPGRSFYHAKDKNGVAFQHRFKPKEKFAEKFMVWQCVDADGNVSTPFVSTGTMNWEVYLRECLKKRLLPFIRQHHPNQRILFWPDLARCHYAKNVTDWLEEQGIPYVLKNENPPNVPQARPIERFWGICKTAYRQRSGIAKSKHAFTCTWARLSKEMGRRHLKNLMKRARPAMRLIRDEHVYAPLVR